MFLILAAARIRNMKIQAAFRISRPAFAPPSQGLRTATVKLRTGAARGDVGKNDYSQADEARNRFGYVHENAEEHRKRKAENRIVRAVFEVGKLVERLRPHESDGKCPHKNRPDTKTADDDGKCRSNGKRADHTVERKCGVEFVEGDEERRAGGRGRGARLDLE